MIVDALSRQFESDTTPDTVLSDNVCALITHIQASWIEEIVSSYEQDKETKNLIAQVMLGSVSSDYTYIAGILRYKGRKVVGSANGVRTKILDTIHSSAVGGHSGIHTSYLRGKSIFYWSGMKKDFTEYISACDICKQCKDEAVAYPGLL